MNFAALLRVHQVIQSGKDDLPLELAVKRHTEMMAHHKRNEHGARWFAVSSYIASNGQRDCGNSSAFNSALHERDGLVSYRSSRTQQGSFCPIGYDRIGDVFCQGAFKAIRIHLVADK